MVTVAASLCWAPSGYPVREAVSACIVLSVCIHRRRVGERAVGRGTQRSVGRRRDVKCGDGVAVPFEIVRDEAV